METIRGKLSLQLSREGLSERLNGYGRIALDLGTGDGRYVRHLAGQHPDWFVIGVDACRENLREHSLAQLPNALYIIAGAERLPDELRGMADHLTINFPWGTLLAGLLTADPVLMNALGFAARASASFELRLNGGALAEAGHTLSPGADRIRDNLLQFGWHVSRPSAIDACALRAFPSTWARRLAHGRDPRAMLIQGRLIR